MINKEQYNKDGYVVLKNVFDPRFLDQLRERYTSVFQKLLDQEIGKISCAPRFVLINLFNHNFGAFRNAGIIIQNMIETYQLMLSPEVMLNVNQLIKDPVVATKPIIFTSHPELSIEGDYWKTPAHRDALSMQSSLNSVICWINLVDCLEDKIGPLQIVPGSHLMEVKRKPFYNNFGEVETEGLEFKPVYMEKGSMLIMNSSVIHKSGENEDQRVRWAVSFRFSDMADTEWTRRNLYSPYIHKLVLDEKYTYSAEDVRKALDVS